MRLNSVLLLLTLKLLCAGFLVATLSACEKKGGKDNFVETPAPKPTAFYDAFGEMWTCIETEDSAAVSGQVSFSRPVSLARADVLHISLLEINDDSTLELIATRCMNNLLTIPIDYNITYNPELINPGSRYVLSSVLFTSIDGETFLASYRPDGFLEVINNDVVSKANITLKVP
jgi:uncharacterized lipoprotein YbaY